MDGNNLLLSVIPELILLCGAGVVLIVGLLRNDGSRAWVSPITLATVVAALIASLSAGLVDDASPAFGLWITPLSYYVRCVTLFVGVPIILVNWHQPAARERGEYMAMILLSMLGVLLTSSANDLLVLFFALELVSIPTYVLIALSREDRRATEASVKYFFLGAFSAAMMAYGLTLLYGASGTTTIYQVSEAGVSSALPSGEAIAGIALIGMLFTIAGLAFKVGAVPFHAYIPDVYEGAASPVTGMLGFIPKLAGFVALIKLLAACNWELPSGVLWMLWAMAVASMTVGNVLALLQRNIKRTLAYSSIAHTGYMMIAVVVGPVAGVGPMHNGVAALLFYMAIYGAMNLGVFALLAAFRVGGRAVETLEDIAGLALRAPLATLGLAICLFSLMGLPPTAGFMGKLYVFASAFSLEQSAPFHGPIVALAIIGVLNAAIAAAYYLRIAASAYMGSEAPQALSYAGAPVRFGLALCSIAMLLFFAWPGSLARYSSHAAMVLSDTIQGGGSELTALSIGGSVEETGGIPRRANAANAPLLPGR